MIKKKEFNSPTAGVLYIQNQRKLNYGDFRLKFNQDINEVKIAFL